MFGRRSKLPAPAIDTLRDAALGIESKWCVGGSVNLDAPLSLSLTKTGASVTPGDKGWVEAVTKAGSPAVFGSGSQTMYNRSVRDAVQIKADDFTLAGVPLTQITGQVSAELLHGQPCEAEPYSLNVYSSGGHFKKHKDTPRGADHIGTVLVCLPSTFSRGEFVLNHGGAVKTFADWGRRADPRKLSWCAFFCDVDHQVNQLWSGNRVTAAFLLKRSGGGDGAAAVAAAASSTEPVAASSPSDALSNALLRFVGDPTILPAGGTLGFPAFHLYTNTQVAVVPEEEDGDVAAGGKKKKKTKKRKPLPVNTADPLSPAAIGCLKGRDATIAEAAARAGLAVRLQPYLTECCADNTWKLPGLMKDKPAKIAKRVDNDRIESWAYKACPNGMGTVEDLSFDGNVGVCWVWEPPTFNFGTSRPKPTRYGEQSKDPDRPAIAALGESNWSATGYFGNEASYTEFYTYASIEVAIPPAGEARDAIVESGVAPAWASSDKPSNAAAASSSAAVAAAAAPPNKKQRTMTSFFKPTASR